MSIMKGGKVVSVTEDPKNRKKVMVEFEKDGKTYNIEGYEDRKRGTFSISKIAEVTVE